MLSPLHWLCLALGLSSSFVSAFDIPVDLGDGVWEITFTSTTGGSLVSVTHYEIDPLLNMTAKEDDSNLPLSVRHGDCSPMADDVPYYGEVAMNTTDLTLAEAALGNWCERYNPKFGSLVLSLHGNASSYFCDYNFGTWFRPGPTHCSKREVFIASWNMDQTCGTDKSASLFQENEKLVSMYGRTLIPMSICPGLQEMDTFGVERTPA